MPKFEVYDENVVGRPSRKIAKTDANRFTTKNHLKHEERRVLASGNNAPSKSESKPVVEVRKSQRNEERRVLGCINNVKDANKNVVFPQKQRNKKKAEEPVAGVSIVVAKSDLEGEYLFANKYGEEVLANLKSLEQRQSVRVDYMKKQAELSHDMRSTLVDWLVEVSEGLKCPPDVIFDTCQYVDRFLSIMSVNNSRLQLLGITCFYLAWKFEDAPGVPYLSDLVPYIGGVCTDKEIIKMEKLVVRTLDFSLMPCSTLTFLNIFLHYQPLPSDTTHSLKYLLESSLLDGQRSLKYLPSLTAASCLAIVREEVCLPPWTDLLTSVTGYRQRDMDKCLKDLAKFKRCLPIEAYANIPNKYHKE